MKPQLFDWKTELAFVEAEADAVLAEQEEDYIPFERDEHGAIVVPMSREAEDYWLHTNGWYPTQEIDYDIDDEGNECFDGVMYGWGKDVEDAWGKFHHFFAFDYDDAKYMQARIPTLIAKQNLIDAGVVKPAKPVWFTERYC